MMAAMFCRNASICAFQSTCSIALFERNVCENVILLGNGQGMAAMFRRFARVAGKRRNMRCGPPAAVGRPCGHLAGSSVKDGSHVLPKCQCVRPQRLRTGISAKDGCHPLTECQLKGVFLFLWQEQEQGSSHPSVILSVVSLSDSENERSRRTSRRTNAVLKARTRQLQLSCKLYAFKQGCSFWRFFDCTFLR